MDLGQTIEYLASSEGRRIRPIVDLEELDELDAKMGIGRRIPAIHVDRASASGRWVARAIDRDPGHDNAERLPFLVDFFNRRVLPLVDPEVDVRGAYRIELHDSYSYLPDRHRYDNVLTFGRAQDALERRVALLPDPYHMDDYGGIVAAASEDPVPWAQKIPKLFFAGTTTGVRNPWENNRIRACMWATDHRDVAELYITNVAQMSTCSILEAHPRFLEAVHAPFPVQAHFPYRYQVNIPGNTACWSRLPMLLSMRSLTIHARSSLPGCADVMWYSPLVQENVHYVGADSAEGPDLMRALAFCKSYERQCRTMVDNANALARNLFQSGSAATYCAKLIETANF